MTWLRKETGLHPAAFMSDCCKALSKGIKEAFKHCHNPPKHYLCVVHVMKAARRKGAKMVSPPTPSLVWRSCPNTNQASSPDVAAEMHTDFVNIIYAPIPFDAYTAFIHKWTSREFSYVSYVRNVWYKCITQWAVAPREVPLQGIHTNNFVESWHHNLKYNFMSRTKTPRPDEFLHGLVFDVEPLFRQAVHTTQLGFANQSSTKFQGIAKGQADTYSQADLEAIGVQIFAVTSQLVRRLSTLERGRHTH